MQVEIIAQDSVLAVVTVKGTPPNLSIVSVESATEPESFSYMRNRYGGDLQNWPWSGYLWYRVIEKAPA